MPRSAKRQRDDGDFTEKTLRRWHGKKRKKTKFWKVDTSTVPFHPRFKGKEKGLGVFAVRSGRFRIYFRDVLHVCKTHMKDFDWKYGIQSRYDESYCMVPPTTPTLNVRMWWRINHSSTSPTHELVWVDEGVPYLCPKRRINKGEEFTYDYG